MRNVDSAIPACNTSMITKAYQKYKTFWVNLARTSFVSQEDGEDIVHGIISSILTRTDLEFESLEHLRNYVARGVLNRAIQIRARGVRVGEYDEESMMR
jgi:hypothetical protein